MKMKIKTMMMVLLSAAVSAAYGAGGVNVDRPWELKAPKSARIFEVGVW